MSFYHYDLKKVGRFEKLLSFGRSHSIVALGSLSLSCATIPHPSCLLDFKLKLKSSKSLIFIILPVLKGISVLKIFEISFKNLICLQKLVPKLNIVNLKGTTSSTFVANSYFRVGIRQNFIKTGGYRFEQSHFTNLLDTLTA